MNILVVRFSALGDLVTLEPTFRAFRHFFPQARITFLTSSIGKGLYEDTPYFDDYIVYVSFFKALRQIREKHYDLVLNLQCNKPSHYMTLLMRKEHIVNKSYTLFQKLFGIKTHSKSAKEMLACAGIDASVLNEYFSQPSHTIIAFAIQKEIHAQKRIAISTGSSPRWPSKQWGITRYEQLIQALLSRGYEITLVGSKLESKDAALLSQKFPMIHNRVAQTNLCQLKTLLANVDLYVGNDSGPTHIAASVGTDTLTIFGSTDVKHSPKFDAYRGTHLYLKPSSEITCHPCYKGVCPTQHECMASINVEDVLTIIQEHFKETHETA